MKRYKFDKYQVSGNDYILIDCDNCDASPQQLAIAILDRKFGVGGDRAIFLSASQTADAKIEVFNSDGSKEKMCASAILCVCIHLHKTNPKAQMQIETEYGISNVTLAEQNGVVARVFAEIGLPTMDIENCKIEKPQLINEPIDLNGATFNVTACEYGDTYLTVFVDDVSTLPLSQIGHLFECHKSFPNRTNVEFVQIANKNMVLVRSWAKGIGEIFSSGTGTAVSVFSAIQNGLLDKNKEVIAKQRGGDLSAVVTDGTAYVAGLAEKVFDGEFLFWYQVAKFKQKIKLAQNDS